MGHPGGSCFITSPQASSWVSRMEPVLNSAQAKPAASVRDEGDTPDLVAMQDYRSKETLHGSGSGVSPNAEMVDRPQRLCRAVWE